MEYISRAVRVSRTQRTRGSRKGRRKEGMEDEGLGEVEVGFGGGLEGFLSFLRVWEVF